MPITLALWLRAATAAADPAGRMTEAQAITFATALHHRMDANGDGYLTPEEEAQFIVRRMNGLAMPGTDAQHPLPPLSAAIFAAADTDHDDRLSLAETIAEAKREFVATDSNHDGVVTPEERMAFMTRMIAAGKLPDGMPLSTAGPGSR